jgi:hypothetical protein
MKTVFAVAAIVLIIAPSAFAVGQAKDRRVPALQRRISALESTVNNLQENIGSIQSGESGLQQNDGSLQFAESDLKDSLSNMCHGIEDQSGWFLACHD